MKTHKHPAIDAGWLSNAAGWDQPATGSISTAPVTVKITRSQMFSTRSAVSMAVPNQTYQAVSIGASA